MTFVRHGQLVASQVSSVALPEGFETVEVVNVDGAAPIYFKVLASRDAAIDPVIEGDDCEVLPAGMGSLVLHAPGQDTPVVKLISAGTPRFSVWAE